MGSKKPASATSTGCYRYNLGRQACGAQRPVATPHLPAAKDDAAGAVEHRKPVQLVVAAVRNAPGQHQDDDEKDEPARQQDAAADLVEPEPAQGGRGGGARE